MVGVRPEGLWLSELYWMAIGKAELLGGTSAAKQEILPYNPAWLSGAVA